MTVGIAFGIWKTKGFRKPLSFDAPAEWASLAAYNFVQIGRVWQDDGDRRHAGEARERQGPDGDDAGCRDG